MEELILFVHNSTLYAIEASVVEEIVEPVSVTLLPNQDENAIVSGLINVHGKIIVQFDFEKIVKKYASPFEQKKIRQTKVASLRPNNVLLLKDSSTYGSSQKAVYVGEVLEKIKVPSSNIQKIEMDTLYKGHFLHNKKMVIFLNLQWLNDFSEDQNALPSWNMAFGRSVSVGKSISHFNEPRYLLIKSNDIIYGIDTKDIDELILLGEVSNVPFLPKHVLGLVNLRDAPMLVVSLASLLQESVGECSYGVVVRNTKGVFILAVQDLLKIEQFAPNQYHLLKKQNTEIKAWAKTDYSNFIPIIDITHIFNSSYVQELETYIQHQDKPMSYLKEQERRFLITLIEDEYYGIPLESIKVVVDTISIQSLPPNENQDMIKGVTQIHGEIIYVLDTVALFRKRMDSYKNYVVISARNRNFVFPIKNVDMVITIPESRLESISSKEVLVKNIAKIDQKLISIVNTEGLVDSLPGVAA